MVNRVRQCQHENGATLFVFLELLPDRTGLVPTWNPYSGEYFLCDVAKLTIDYTRRFGWCEGEIHETDNSGRKIVFPRPGWIKVDTHLRKG